MANLQKLSSFLTCFAFGSQSDTSIITAVVATSTGHVVYSYDEELGYSFDDSADIESPNLRSLVLYNETFVGVGDKGIICIFSSADPASNYTFSYTSSGVNLRSIIEYDGVLIAAGDDDTVIRSTDGGSSWSDITVSSDSTDYYCLASDGAGNILLVGDGGSVWISDDSGETFTEKSLSITYDLRSCCHAGTNWVISGTSGYLAYLNAAASSVTAITSGTVETINVVLNNKVACGGGGYTSVIDTDLGGVTLTASSGASFVGGTYASSIDTYFAWGTLSSIYYSSSGFETGNWDGFLPLSDDYRSTDYAVLNGYSILIGTLEYDSESGWQYNPRRLRWSSPGTLLDFASTGAGAGDLNGRGSLVCGTVVNERLVLFESESISAIVPTGIVADPWNYERLHEGLWSLSNPVVANDKCYFIGSDGLVYITNGLSVSTLNTAFDLTEFTDFDREDVVILAYSSELQSLLVFVPPATTSGSRDLHVVQVESGAYSTFELPVFVVNDDSYIPKTIIARNDNYLSTVMVGYVLDDGTATANLLTVEFDFDGAGLIDSGSTDTDTYHMDLQTGEFDLVDEAVKSSIKHILIDVYSDVANAGEVGVQVKSSEDTQWWSANDFNGTFTITGTALAVTGSSLSNLIAAGDDATSAFTLPCLASQARVYLGSALQVLGTGYTITDTKEITLTSALPTGTSLYVYWENEPEIRVNTNDLFEDENGKMHRLTTITNWNTGVVTPGTASSAATHIPAETVSSVGSSQLSIGVNKSVEGAQIRIIVVPRTDVAGTLKVTGISIGHVPTRASRRVS